MMTFLNAKFDLIGGKKFYKLAPILCFIADIILVYYINNVYLNEILTVQKLAPFFKLQGINLHSLPMHELNDFLAGAKLMSSNIFWLLLIYNAIIYTCCLKDFRWAKKYVKGYAFTGSALSVIECAFLLLSKGTINPYTFVTMLIYTFCYLGMKRFKRTLER